MTERQRKIDRLKIKRDAARADYRGGVDIRDRGRAIRRYIELDRELGDLMVMTGVSNCQECDGSGSDQSWDDGVVECYACRGTGEASRTAGP